MGNEYDFTGKHFEAKAVSRGEFEALKRFPDYEELSDGTLLRIEGTKEFRIYCEDVEGCPFGVIREGFCTALSEADDRVMEGLNKDSTYLTRLC